MIRTYARVQVEDEALPRVLGDIERLADACETVPGVLQSEAFYAKDTSTVVLLESFVDVDAYTQVFAAADVEASRGLLWQRGDVQSFRVHGTLPDRILNEIRASGLPVEVGCPMSGDAGPSASRVDRADVQVAAVIRLREGAMDAYRAASGAVEVDARRYPGVVYHRAFRMDDQRVALLEGYESGEALLSWAQEGFARHRSAVGATVETLVRVDVLGEIHGDPRALMDRMRSRYFERHAGFCRLHSLDST